MLITTILETIDANAIDINAPMIQRMLSVKDEEFTDITLNEALMAQLGVFLAEAKRNIARQTGMTPTQINSVVFQICPMFEETVGRFSSTPRVMNRVRDFIDYKQQDPMAKFGSNDTSMTVTGGQYNGFNHANITNDLRIFYTKDSQNPVVIKMYAVLTHDEAGIGQPANIKRQKQMSTRMRGQTIWNVIDPKTF